jgi:ATP-binding cassette, subfamily A (ABC1), member 3
MELQLRQLRTLVRKNLLLLTSSWPSLYGTIVTAITYPIIIGAYLTVIIRAYIPGATYGIGNAAPIKGLTDAMGMRTGTLVLMNNASSVGGDIDRVIKAVASGPQAAGRSVLITTSEDELRITCRSNFQGVTKCFAGVVFQSSPNEGQGGLWNYTLRGNFAFGRTNLDVTSNSNDVEVNIFPLQHAIDSAISALNGTADSKALPSIVDEYLITSESEDERKRQITLILLQANISAIAIVWILTLISVTFRLVGMMAKERESEMSDLIESVMPNIRRWEPQAIRLAALHITFDLVYLFSWIVVAILFRLGYFKYTSVGIPIIGFVLGGLAVTSFSILGASFFKKAQLSSIIIIGIAILLGIAAQITAKHLSDAAMIITSLLFTPMAFVNFIICICHWEHEGFKVNLIKRAPNSPSGVPAIVFLICFIIQTFLYPVLAALVERSLYGTAVSRTGRDISMRANSEVPPVVVSNMTKVYKHSWFWGSILKLFGKSTVPVVAVKDLSLTVPKGQIMVLVGANGCGKSTTLNAIAGLHNMTSGHITVDGSGGIGICPQKNVLWNSLSVHQHATIFNKLKSAKTMDVGRDLDSLIKSCGLQEKLKTPSKNLSGGQKRKLQLLMMLTGGSQVCCVDEASGGLDPVSRRKIWDILLSERGIRTVILTTHFLDEAEFLADTMVIMANGAVGAEGSVSELKSKLGNGYRVHVRTPKRSGSEDIDIDESETFDTGETFAEPSQALRHIKTLESQGVTNYQIAGPTIEEVFMKLAADPESEYQESPDSHLHPSVSRVSRPDSSHKGKGDFIQRQHIGLFHQILILFSKRITVWRRNPLPLLITLLTPIIATALLVQFLRHVQNEGCAISDQFASSDIQTLSSTLNPDFVVGPLSAFNNNSLSLVTGLFPSNTLGKGNSSSTLLNAVKFVNSLDEFNSYTKTNYANVTPGGLYIGDSSSPPTFNVRSDLGILGIYSGVFVQNILDVLLTNIKIAAQYASFDVTFPSSTGDTIQFITYFGLVCAAFPAFFTLYPCQERVRNVRAMEYSNGVRPLPLWTAYLLFDWINTLISSVFIIIILAAATGPAWYHIGYMFFVLILYGLASVLLAYVLSKIAKSHFSAFAFSAGGQA